MRSGNNERKSSSVDCDVGLGLKMPTQSYTCSSDLGGGGAVDVFYRNNNNNNNNNNTLFYPQNRPGAGAGKSLFTESQWQELERQNLINRYIVASIPVPPQLLFLPHHHHHVLPSQTGLDLRGFGSSDPEPWRCKRTDGKKWRCSRDVAPDQKYCERHAHKTKPRSRKHVEISSSSSSLHPPHPFQISSSHHQTRPVDWFMRGAKHQMLPTTKDHDDAYHPNKTNKQAAAGFYIPDTSALQMDSPQTTRHFFIDAWEKDVAFDMGMTAKIKKPSPSSLSLSMSGYNNVGIAGYDREDDDRDLGIGMMTSASASWMNTVSPPGGPLGEALCLGGNASSTRGGSNLASPYSNSSRSSCEDGTHALNFIGS